MLLIVGAKSSGKRTYARLLGFNDDDFLDASTLGGKSKSLTCDEHKIVFGLEGFIEQAVKKGSEPDIDELVNTLAKREIVICDEVGSGVIPADPDLIKARELTGRLCILLASQSKNTIRMVCGIPTNLK